MSGITGIINLNRQAKPVGVQELKAVKQAVDMQAHRGPDGSAICAFTFAGTSRVRLIPSNTPDALFGSAPFDGVLGFNRFSTRTSLKDIPLPFVSADGAVVVAFDGELSNRNELSSHAAPVPDEAVIAELYGLHGIEKTLMLLNGVFSLVIADLRQRICYIARDRLGGKPMYWSRQGNRLLFASELKAFTCFPDFPRQLDLDAYNARLMFNRPGSKVLLKDVEMLDPGTYIAAGFDGDFRVEKWFSLDSYHRREGDIDPAEAVRQLSDLIEDAVGRQLDFDVPFATQVSGGIDSTLVNHYIKQHKGAAFRNGISIVDGTGHRGEEYWIDRVRDAFDLELQKYQLSEDFFLNNYEQLVWYNDAPIYKPYFTSFYKMAYEARGSAKILFSGEGADETAGGYGRFAAGVFQPFFSQKQIRGKGIAPFVSYAEYAVASDQTYRDFTTLGYTGSEELFREQTDIFSSFTGSNFTKQLKYETFCRLPESFMRQEKMAAANSIQIRVPLVDYKVLDYIMELPESLLLSFVAPSPVGLSDNPFEWVQGKYIFKELCAQKMGRDFAYRNKQIIVFDERNILRADAFRTLFYDRVLPSMKDRALLDVQQIENWYANIATISQKEFNMMWRAISLETWCHKFLT